MIATTLEPSAPWPIFVFMPQPRGIDAVHHSHKLVLAYLADNPGATSVDACKATGLSISKASSALSNIEKAGNARSELGTVKNRAGRVLKKYFLIEAQA